MLWGSIESPMLRGVCWDPHVMLHGVCWDPHAIWGLLLPESFALRWLPTFYAVYLSKKLDLCPVEFPVFWIWLISVTVMGFSVIFCLWQLFWGKVPWLGFFWDYLIRRLWFSDVGSDLKEVTLYRMAQATMVIVTLLGCSLFAGDGVW